MLGSGGRQWRENKLMNEEINESASSRRDPWVIIGK